MPDFTSTYEKNLMLKPAKIKRLFGIDQRTLRTMRENPKANKGDVPKFIMICNRPHYPAADFDIWFQRQKQRTQEQSARSAISAITPRRNRTAD